MLVGRSAGANPHPELAAFRFIGWSLPGGPWRGTLRSSRQPMTGAEQSLLCGCHLRWPTDGQVRVLVVEDHVVLGQPDRRGPARCADSPSTSSTTARQPRHWTMADSEVQPEPLLGSALGSPPVLHRKHVTTGSTATITKQRIPWARKPSYWSMLPRPATRWGFNVVPIADTREIIFDLFATGFPRWHPPGQPARRTPLSCRSGRAVPGRLGLHSAPRQDPARARQVLNLPRHG